MAETAVQYFERLCKEAGKTDAEIAGMKAVLADPKFNQTVYSAEELKAMQGRVDAAERKFQDEWKKYYDPANAEYQRAIAELNQTKATLAAISAGGDQPAIDTAKFLTKEDLQRYNQEQSVRFSHVIKQATHLASRHAAKYKEALDTEALEKVAIDKGYQKSIDGVLVPDLMLAYRDMNESRDRETDAETRKKEIEDAKAEAVKEYASKHQLPVDERPAEVAPMFLGTPAEPVKDRDADLLAAWRGAGRGR